MSEMFKPKQFDSFDKVPKNQKKNFKNEADGSFVYKEAAEELSDAELTAEIANELEKQGITSIDVLHDRANEMESKREKYFNIAIQDHPHGPPFIPDEFRTDKEFITAVVEKKPAFLKEVSNKIVTDKEFMLSLIKRERYAFQYLPEELRNDKDFVLAAVKQDGWVLEFVPARFQANKEIVLEAVKQPTLALQFASEELQADKEVVLESVKNSGSRSFSYASKSIREEVEKLLKK